MRSVCRYICICIYIYIHTHGHMTWRAGSLSAASRLPSNGFSWKCTSGTQWQFAANDVTFVCDRWIMKGTSHEEQYVFASISASNGWNFLRIQSSDPTSIPCITHTSRSDSTVIKATLDEDVFACYHWPYKSRSFRCTRRIITGTWRFEHGPGYRSLYSDSLWAGRSGDGNPMGARFSTPVQTGPGTHPASCTIGTLSFPVAKWPGRGASHPTPFSRRG
jgi:hypothetical protein